VLRWQIDDRAAYNRMAAYMRKYRQRKRKAAPMPTDQRSTKDF
jgi:hypothetical protein